VQARSLATDHLQNEQTKFYDKLQRIFGLKYGPRVDVAQNQRVKIWKIR
jgi:hypothetical protein